MDKLFTVYAIIAFSFGVGVLILAALAYLFRWASEQDRTAKDRQDREDYRR